MDKTKVTARPSDSSAATIQVVKEQTGLSSQKLHDRLFDWFGRQDPGLQALILGVVPEKYEGQVAELVLKEIQAPKPAGKIGPGVRSRSGGRAAKDGDKQSRGKRN